MKEVLRHKHGGTLFEIGCAKGDFLKQAAEDFTVRGIEISPYAATQAAAPVHDRIQCANVEETALPPQAYDVVAAFNVLEHLRQPAPVVEGIARGLRPEGLLIGTVPLKRSLVGRVHTWLTNRFDRTHVATYTPRRWAHIFRAAGFTSIRFFGEIMFGKNHNVLVHHGFWPHVSLNLVFLCRK